MVRLNDPDRFAHFVEQLSSTLGVEPEIREVPPREPGDGQVFALIYADTPEPGFISGFTYGLSLWEGADSLSSSRELCIVMRSNDSEWAKVPAITVAALRGMCPFDPGMVIGYMKPYVPGSGLSSLLLAVPSPRLMLADQIDLARSGMGSGDFVEIIGAYPIYASERKIIHAQGAGVVWNSEWDPYDPARPAVV
ncbi:suppressor of fused domain protein [Streptomyces mirabilis]|uniref:suppressor of fused domain protein n=1 Tax=Streptomyces mirabilis TaxID=68239 RepID=UPI001BAE64A2|nr:suppressor of fused domain protein [Streptomyces mirabilis]QUW84484.1 suppressor of fused domain protein [Streptomyces mirabilis]